MLPNPNQKLSPQQEAIQNLGGILSAVYFETNDQIIKQFISMMVGVAAKEYDEQTDDPIAPALFTPEKLTATFRQSITTMREGLKDLERLKLVERIKDSENGKGKH